MWPAMHRSNSAKKCLHEKSTVVSFVENTFFQSIFYALSLYLSASIIVVQCSKLVIDKRLFALSFKLNMVNNLTSLRIPK